MKYKTLGDSGLLVSTLCLGTMTFNGGEGFWKAIETVDQAGADEIIKASMEAGINFFDTADVEWLHTCTIITGEPNELVAQIHTRMPVILAEAHHEAWLNNQAGKEVLVPFPADAMKAWPISPRVNSPKNNDPDLIRPLAA